VKTISFSSDDLSGAGIFTKSLDLNLPNSWTGDVALKLYAQLNATGGFDIPLAPTQDLVPNLDFGGAADIQLKVANLSVGTNAVVPVPAAIATFPMLAGIAGIAHRKFRGKKA
jgi:hypothetical protein